MPTAPPPRTRLPSLSAVVASGSRRREGRLSYAADREIEVFIRTLLHGASGLRLPGLYTGKNELTRTAAERMYQAIRTVQAGDA